MNPLWNQAKCLPIVRDKVLLLCKTKPDWVVLGDLIAALLEDPIISREVTKVRAVKKEKGSNIVANMVGFLNEWITRYENGTIPASWFDFAAEIYSSIERKKIGRTWAYKLRDSNERLRPNYWIFVCKDDGKRSAVQIYEEDMRNQYWGINEKARNISRLSLGDKAVFYLGDSGKKSFFGTSTLSSRYLDTKEASQKGHDFPGVELVHIELWDQPKPIELLISRLHFIKNKSDYRQHLRGSIHQISEKDYITIVGKKNKKMVRVRAELAKESREPEPKLTEPTHLKKTMIKMRSAEFRRAVRENYDYSCAVCGRSRFTKNENPEVESAHIYPVKKNGSNDPRNGIALCRLHHWAFGNGLFSIRDDYSIVVEKRIKEDENYKEISSFEKKKISLPKNHLPHAKFLRKHRKIHGFK